MKTRSRIALALLSGILVPLGFIGFGFYPLAWIAMLPCCSPSGSSAAPHFWLSIVYGLVAHFGGYHSLAHTSPPLAAYPAFPRGLPPFSSAPI